jgi:hypothetical protein
MKKKVLHSLKKYLEIKSIIEYIKMAPATRKATGKLKARTGKRFGNNRTYKKKTNGMTNLKKAEKATTEHLFYYSAGLTKIMLDNDLLTTVAEKSACIETIPICVNASIAEAWNKQILNKYEQYRISKVEVKIMFKNVDEPIFYILDKDANPVCHPSQLVHDPEHRYQPLSTQKNTLFVSWTPKETSDYEYAAVTGTIPTVSTAENPYKCLNAPLGYIHVLQHGIEQNVGKDGCSMQVKVSIACKGQKSTAVLAATTAAQLAAMNNAAGLN